jgi:hypothetical protein
MVKIFLLHITEYWSGDVLFRQKFHGMKHNEDQASKSLSTSISQARGMM